MSPRSWFRKRFGLVTADDDAYPEWHKRYDEQHPEDPVAMRRRPVAPAGQSEITIPGIYEYDLTARQDGLKVRATSGQILVWLEGRWWNEHEYERETRRNEMLAESSASRINKAMQHPDSVGARRMTAFQYPDERYPGVQKTRAQEDQEWWEKHRD